jgi:hypothetical protein
MNYHLDDSIDTVRVLAAVDVGPNKLDLVGRILPDGRHFKLSVGMVYFVKEAASLAVVKVPIDFVTDFASVPRLLWQVLPPWGPYSTAALFHDYLYRSGLAPRAEADAIFLEIMKELGVSWWKRRSMWATVRLFGWVASRKWKQQRRKES